ncbi:hypothetical protein [Catenovulum maritimum]|uniref:Glycoside-hydrolase family GH114 TIM-barrel domain-containing protein n=1 Tax=Catenovulum maritimum TaxID=1513271 RepID=A0A0J8GRZ9_9ALTE|nr:hypothetical protein [Catenovulum maritimum]KMT65575.1 hypothetical protein XM47_07680 [Catenovulum maritimum]
MKIKYLTIALLISLASASITACAVTAETQEGDQSSFVERIKNKSYPAVFQAWNPLDMPETFKTDSLANRLKTAAKHSLLWEEPVSQLGFNTPLVLGLVWDDKYAGMATQFTQDTLFQAKQNRKTLLDHNPDMVLLMEIRWRDAPGSYFPEDCEYWARNPDGTRVMGWDGGPEPYYIINYENENFQQRVAQQARAAVDSGIYDGVMLDWSGHLEIIKKIKHSIGQDGLILVNIHDEIDKVAKYKDYINGAFMECGPETDRLCTWEKMQQALAMYETEFQSPQINALELWTADRNQEQAMRAITTMGITHSDGYVLYADRNPLPTPDHLHNWYSFWDADLGKPVAKGFKRSDGAYQREFEKGVAVYNPPFNKPVKVVFDKNYLAVSTQVPRPDFDIPRGDGEIFLQQD